LAWLAPPYNVATPSIVGGIPSQGFGPWLSGAGNLYLIATVFTGDAAFTYARMYKSTDHGVLWAEMDSPGAPVSSFSQNAVQSGNIVSLMYGQSSSGDYRVISFNFATDTWSSESPNGPPDNDESTDFIVAYPSGDREIVFVRDVNGDGSDLAIHSAVYSSGSWGSEKVILDNAGTNTLTGVLDSDGHTVHVVYNDGNIGALRYLHFSGSTVSSPQTIITPNPNSVNPSTVVLWNNSIVFLIGDNQVNPGDTSARLCRGTPISSPSWTSTIIDDLATTWDVTSPTVSVGTDGSLYMVYAVNNFFSGDGSIDRIYYRALSVGNVYSLTQLAWDAKLYPPTLSPPVVPSRPLLGLGVLNPPSLFGIAASAENDNFIVSADVIVYFAIPTGGVGYLNRFYPMKV
jgi:hypothetical protein